MLRQAVGAATRRNTRGRTRSRSRTLWAARADLKELIVSPIPFQVIFELHLFSPMNLSILEIALYFVPVSKHEKENTNRKIKTWLVDFSEAHFRL